MPYRRSARPARIAFAVAASAALLVGATWLWRAAPEFSGVTAADTAAVPTAAAPRPGQRDSQRATTVHALAGLAPQPADSNTSKLPPSLRGSRPDGNIRFDAAGDLILDRALRHRFDYWLTGLGEISVAALRSRFEQSLRADLDPDQIGRVLAEFDLYTEYLMAADDLLPLEFGSSSERHRALIELQLQLLGESRAEAWFGEQNRYIDRTLAAMNRGVEEGHPGDGRWAEEAEAATGHHSALALGSPEVRETLSPEVLHQQRRRLFGDAAAERLATLDAHRTGWNSRLSRFAQARRELVDQGGPNTRAALNALLEQNFDPAEQRRVLALLDAGLLPETEEDG